MAIKIRAKQAGGVTTVKALMNHPMETGQRKDGKGNKIPAHYIQEVKAEHNGKTVMTAYWGPAVSKNPYISFKFKGGAKGDMLKLSWLDNKGKSESNEAEIG
jgi:sulfur-oxidizing protein SoxZ